MLLNHFLLTKITLERNALACVWDERLFMMFIVVIVDGLRMRWVTFCYVLL